jgi:hypothetical protein
LFNLSFNFIIAFDFSNSVSSLCFISSTCLLALNFKALACLSSSSFSASSLCFSSSFCVSSSVFILAHQPFFSASTNSSFNQIAFASQSCSAFILFLCLSS